MMKREVLARIANACLGITSGGAYCNYMLIKNPQKKESFKLPCLLSWNAINVNGKNLRVKLPATGDMLRVHLYKEGFYNISWNIWELFLTFP